MVSLSPVSVVFLILGIVGIYALLKRDRFSAQWLALMLIVMGGIAIFLLFSLVMIDVIGWTYQQLGDMSKDKPMMNTIVRGGPIVMVLYFLLILTLALTGERIYYIIWASRGRATKDQLMKKILPMLEKNQYDEAMDACIKHKGAIGRLVGTVINRYKLIGDSASAHDLYKDLIEVAEETSAIEQAMIERNFIAVATIGSIANLMGLLGTVIGMINSFSAISFGQVTKQTHVLLAQGISQALVSAAGGLVVAILAVIFYNYFTSRSDRFNLQLGEVSGEVLKIFKQKRA
jgi:biopolymer transport protein ExbB